MSKGLFDVERLYQAQTTGELIDEYDRVATGYDRALLDEHAWCAPEIMAGVAAWLLPRSSRILDAACGTGLVGDGLRRLGFAALHGLDLSNGMLEVARRKGTYEATTLAALGAALPFADHEFDAFCVCGAFTPKHAPAESLDELVRVTRPGGYAIFTLRADDPAPGFDARIGSLSAAGRWSLLHVGTDFQSLPKAEPHVRNRIHVYRIS